MRQHALMPAVVAFTLAGLVMTAVALVGGVTLLLSEATLRRVLLPLVAFAAGALLGGAFFHMLPGGVAALGDGPAVWAWTTVGFAVFFALEQFLHWHHCHRASAGCKEPLTYLVLLGDGLHNFLGGLAVGGTFLIDVRLGLTAWLAALAHEVPQELGDFAVLVHGGWRKTSALLLNVASASTFLLGGLLCFAVSDHVQVAFLLPFAAGNFIYIGASDLVPEVNKHRGGAESVLHFAAFALGLGLLFALRGLAGERA